MLAVETFSDFLVLLFDFFVLIFACVIFAAHVTFHSVLRLFFIKGDTGDSCKSVVIGAASERNFIVFQILITRIKVRQSARFNVGSVRFWSFATEQLLIKGLLVYVLSDNMRTGVIEDGRWFGSVGVGALVVKGFGVVFEEVFGVEEFFCVDSFGAELVVDDDFLELF